LGADCHAGAREEARPRATEEDAVGFGERVRLDIESEKQRTFAARTVIIGVLLPGIDRNDGVAPQRYCLALNLEFLVRARDLEDEVTMRMGVSHQRGVHVEQCDAPEPPAKDAARPGHGFASDELLWYFPRTVSLSCGAFGGPKIIRINKTRLWRRSPSRRKNV